MYDSVDTPYVCKYKSPSVNINDIDWVPRVSYFDPTQPRCAPHSSLCTMAALAQVITTVEDNTRLITVPNSPIAMLMYYLKCVTHSLGLHVLPNDLINYANPHALSLPRSILVVKKALELSPDLFINKMIFNDDAARVVPAGQLNTYITTTRACRIVSVQSSFALAAHTTTISNVMLYKSAWLNEVYYTPLECIRLAGPSKHCQHCDGENAPCSCWKCPLGSRSECIASFWALLDAVLGPKCRIPPERLPRIATPAAPELRDRTPVYPTPARRGRAPVPPSRSPHPPREGRRRGWGEGDVVVLTGLKTVSMNGKKAIVQSVERDAGKVTVFVEAVGKSFSVKIENNAIWVEVEDLV